MSSALGGRVQLAQVEPSIFGALLEGGLGHDKQWALGAHYTHEADIQKVVQPTIVEPWRERIETCRPTPSLAAQNDLMQLRRARPRLRLGQLPLRRLPRASPARAAAAPSARRAAEARPGSRTQGALGLYFPLSNIRGIEIDGFAVALARVTLWMGHKLAVDELELEEATLPLADLSGIQVGDALKMRWPRADAIIGNPPFHGDGSSGASSATTTSSGSSREFRVGVKDYCVYWFRKAHDHLAPAERAGLVGTNSITQNRASRGRACEYIVDNGGVITSARSQPGLARRGSRRRLHRQLDQAAASAPPPSIMLDGHEVPGITYRARWPGLGDRCCVSPCSAEDRIAVLIYVSSYLENGSVLYDSEAAHTCSYGPGAVVRALSGARRSFGDDIANESEPSNPSRSLIYFACFFRSRRRLEYGRQRARCSCVNRVKPSSVMPNTDKIRRAFAMVESFGGRDRTMR